MAFIIPMVPFLGVYILAAVLPAFLLLRYVYRQDRVEREPVFLLLSLLLFGVISALCAAVLEGLLQTVLDMFLPQGTLLYTVLLAFLVVAVVEEGMKFFFLKRRTWYHPAFNYRFDGIVYSVFVSLGFAAYENIQYVLHYGLSVALPRALLAVPGHMSFAVCMGVFYGRAKLCESYGKISGERRNLWRGYLTAVFLHGFYDACAMTGTSGATVVFVVFVILMYLRVYRILKRESMSDAPV